MSAEKVCFGKEALPARPLCLHAPPDPKLILVEETYFSLGLTLGPRGEEENIYERRRPPTRALQPRVQHEFAEFDFTTARTAAQPRNTSR